MSNRRNKDTGFSNFGFSTILLAFVMICIVTISAVSLLTGNSDYKLSKKVAERNSAYYEAEKQAYTILAEIDYLLADAYQNTESSQDYYQRIENSLSAYEYGIYETTAANHTYSYAVPISEEQDLTVVLWIHYPTGPNETFYEVYTWKSEYEVTTHEEETLNLFQ